MGTSTDAILAYGYDLGAEENLQVREAQESETNPYGYLKTGITGDDRPVPVGAGADRAGLGRQTRHGAARPRDHTAAGVPGMAARFGLGVTTVSDPWRCPNDPPCQHPGVLHDIYDRDDERPTCCAEGCRCGREGCDGREAR